MIPIPGISADNHLRATPSQCDHEWLTHHMEHILPCYLLKSEPESNWSIAANTSQTVYHDNQQTEVSITHVNLVSLRWEHAEQTPVDHPLWQHRLTLYHPENLLHDKALLFINGGIIHPDSGTGQTIAKPEVSFARIAARTKSIVIELKDVPNQFLQFHNTPPLKENHLVAFTWALFFNNPQDNYHWPLQLPMVKASVLAMDAAEEILMQREVSLNGFVLTGGSKRGWTASLTAAQDRRVVALIPQVADFMNMKKMIDHICKVYPKGNPSIAPYLSLKAYVLKPEMEQLMTIIDPYQYKQWLQLPKYIVSASGDHFIPPDTNKVFFDDLPGDKWMRVLPNQGHYITRDNASLITDLTESFYAALIQQRPLPDISWNLCGELLNVTTSRKPTEGWLWQSTNASTRDFRQVASNTGLLPYTRTKVDFDCHGGSCTSMIKLPQNKSGWTASFVEMHFKNEPFADLVFTTRVFVQPDEYPNRTESKN